MVLIMNIHQADVAATHSNLDPDLPKRFFKQLGDTFTFQTFCDSKTDKDPSMARVIHAATDDILRHFHAHGAGVYVTVNETDGKGRKSENITRVRAVWQEDDDGFSGTFRLEPTMVIESS